MAKKQKTLKQKILSDKRYLDITSKNALPEPQIHVALNSSIEKNQPAISQTISVNEYQYLYKDLLKTALLTTLIIVLEILIRLTMEN